jgi:hypothetical protein
MGRTLHLVLSCHGVVGALVHLPREPKRVRQIYLADRWVWASLAVRTTPGSHGSETSMALGMPCMIPDMVHVKRNIHGPWHVVHDPGHGSRMIATSYPW